MAAPSRARPGDRMSDAEALMWNLEKDPALRSSFANLTFLDRPPDPDRFRERMEMAVRTFPRLRQRVVQPPARLAPPLWSDDPDFDLDFHIRRMGAPAPGDQRAVLDLAARLSEDPFDRARPLWQFVLIDGLEGGRGAMFQKLHHTITDGEGGIRLSAQFLDLERVATVPMTGPPPEPADAGANGPDGTTGGGPLRPLQVAAGTVVHAAGRGVATARAAAGAATDLARHPGRAPGLAADVVETIRSVARQLAVTEPARSPLWTRRGLTRHLEILRVPLDDAKRAAKNLGGTVNDFFVTGAAAAAGAYHRAKGAPVEELRVAMPVSTRTDRSVGGNAFAPTRVLLPTAEMHPAEHFAAVRERLTTTKSERALGLAEALAGVVNALPTSLVVQFARQQAATIDFATSNVRGAPFDLYIAGALIEGNFPLGPTAGTAFNLTTLSYRGSLDMGCNIDTAAVDDPALLKACLEEAYRELLAAGA